MAYPFKGYIGKLGSGVYSGEGERSGTGSKPIWGGGGGGLMTCYSTLLCEHEERDITHYTGERTKKEAKQKQRETQNWTETQWKIQRVRTTDCRLLYGREAATEQHFLPRRSRHRDTRSFVPTNNSLAVSSDTDRHKNSIFTEGKSWQCQRKATKSV